MALTFKNPAERQDQGNLVHVLRPSGNFIAANFTGK